MATRGSQCITPKTYQLVVKRVQETEEDRDNVILHNANCGVYSLN